MEKKGIIIALLAILLVGVGISLYFIYRFKLEVTLTDNLNVEFGQEFNLKDLIVESNGSFEDKYVTFYELGEKEVTLSYLDTYDKERSYTIKVNVVDETDPIILSNASVTGYIGEEINLLNGVICADYVSNYVECIVEGDYDINTLGSYALKYVATDESGNSASKDFVYNVIEKPKTTYSYPTTPNYIQFEEIYSAHKTDKTLVGIDVSRYQGNIDFEKIKNAGADFVIIRLGWHVDGEFGLDAKYEENIEKAHNAGLKIGLYFYSEASTQEDIDNTVDFIVDNIKYDIDLPIAYDWEDFKNYNSYHISLYEFNNLAYRFMDKLNEKGYDSILYGSKYYLTNLWNASTYPVWLAQYYTEVTYEGDYKMWQITDNGKIDGITYGVDVDILYLD
ncbi:MAG: hypothetical protein IJ565_05470 [Bacilli bacterium]|nr:hypothetical protein [Bacilli bacterium]